MATDVKRVSFLEWTFDADIDATREAYRAVERCGPEECGCDYCKNWVLARNSIYPASVRKLLADVGIDPPCEAEVWEAGPHSGARIYGGWLHFVGRIAAGPQPIDSHQSPNNPYVDVGDDFNVWFSYGSSPRLHALEGRELVQMDFHTKVPWLLDSPEPP